MQVLRFIAVTMLQNFTLEGALKFFLVRTLVLWSGKLIIPKAIHRTIPRIRDPKSFAKPYKVLI